MREQLEPSERVWLDYSQASQRTGLARVTLWRAVRRGDLRVGGVGGAPRFNINDVDEFMRCGRSGRDR
jgi:hypothetical protein